MAAPFFYFLLRTRAYLRRNTLQQHLDKADRPRVQLGCLPLIRFEHKLDNVNHTG